jgi:biopolymer transport protein TolR
MKIVVPSRRGADIEMVPLIDTFFLLLAFFISSVLSMSVLKGLPLELPSARSAERLKPEDLLVITVANDGQVQLDGTAVTLKELETRLQADTDPSTLRVAVRADRSVPTGQLVKVLSAVQGAGVRRAGLVTDAADEAQVP